MINQSLRDHFLEKHAAHCTPKQLYENFSYYFSKYASNNERHPTEALGNCLWYIKKLLTNFHPSISMRAVCKFNGQEFTLQQVEENYIHLIHTVAHLELFHEDYRSAGHWSKKALDSVEFFHPHLKEESQQMIIENNKHYRECQILFLECFDFFDEVTHQIMKFDWEKDFYSPPYHDNQNHY